MSGGPFSILVAGSDESRLQHICASLEARGHSTVLCQTSGEAVERARAAEVDLTILLLPMEGTAGADLLRSLRSAAPTTPVIVTGTDPSVPSPVDVLDGGALEYIEDVTSPTRLLSVVGIALGARESDVHLRYLRGKHARGHGWDALVGESEPMQRLIGRLRQLSRHAGGERTPAILLGGETGTGKGLVARCIHYSSVRRTQPFVDVNCAAIPPSLIEAELFGHERGSFTGATGSSAGLFRTADKGTLFLDEISSLPLDLQGKLLTAIEDKVVRPIGAHQPVRVDVQIIAATHEDVPAMVSRREFREDLYHRLNVVSVHLPPLREREGDKILLAEAFVDQMCRAYGLPPRRLAEDAREMIRTYPWPGNVRELRNVLERVLLLEEEPVITATQLQLPTEGAHVDINRDGHQLRVRLPSGEFSLPALERAVIREALDKFEGNVSRAARYLSISRQTLIYRIKKYELG